MSEANKIEDIVVGEYGVPIIVQLVDSNNVAVDISAYSTSKVIYLRSPDHLKSVTCTASYVTDGTDGKLTFTPADGNIDRDGTWLGQVKLTSASAVVYSVEFEMEVSRRLNSST